MKFFLDTVDPAEIENLVTTGMVDGVTTNPSLMARSGVGSTGIDDRVRLIASLVDGPISVECTLEDYGGMLEQGRHFASLSEQVVVKVPLTLEGLRACRALVQDGIRVNVTLCFSSVQALLAAKAGASYVSPFVGRLDDVGADGMGLIAEIVEMFSNYDFSTQVLVASVRHPDQVAEAAQLGADVATLPPGILRKLYEHPLTDRGLELFNADWQKAQRGE